jgi:hypothetical protein
VSANPLERAKCSAVVCRSIVVVAVSRVGKHSESPFCIVEAGYIRTF